MKLTVNLKENSYPIYIENGILNPPSWRTDKKFRHTSESLLRNA